MESNALKTHFTVIGREKDSFIESYIGERVIHTHDEGDKNLGEFFLIVEILNKMEEGEDVGDTIVEAFRKKFYEVSDHDDYTRFEEALKSVNDAVRKMEEEDGLILSHLNMAIGALVDNDLFLSQSNDAEVYLARGGNVSNISEGLSGGGRKKKGADVFENIASGVLQEGDRVLFSSARLFRYISKTEMGKLVYGKDIELLIGVLEDALSTEVLGRVGIVGVEVDISLEEEGSEAFKKKSGNKFKNVLATFRELAASFLTGKRITIDKESKRKMALGFGASLIVLFLIIYVILTRGVVSKELKEKRALLANLVEQVEEAKLEVSKERQKELLFGAEAEAKKLLDDRNVRAEVSEVLADVKLVKQELDNVVFVEEPVLVSDVSQKKSDVDLLGILKLEDSYYVYDNKNLFEVIAGVVKDPVPIFEDETSTGVKAAASFADFDSVVMVTGDNKVKEYGEGILKYFDTDDGAYKDSTFALTYGSRLYLLDKNTGQIWRYSRKRDSYATAEPYFEIPPVSNPLTMAIDGAVYIIDSQGFFYKYYASEPEPGFGVIDAPMIPIKTPTDMYTSNETSFLYVFEPSEKRVVEFFKNPATGNLEYTTQYVFNTLDDLQGFYFDELEKKIYVTTSDSIYSTVVKR
jgi:hypothetical protein